MYLFYQKKKKLLNFVLDKLKTTTRENVFKRHDDIVFKTRENGKQKTEKRKQNTKKQNTNVNTICIKQYLPANCKQYFATVSLIKEQTTTTTAMPATITTIVTG